MRVAILTTQVPFVSGGAELLATNLATALRQAGHEAAIVTVPFRWHPPTAVIDHTVGARLFDVSDSAGVPIDRAIALKFPAWMVKHPAKTLWVVHQHRQAYEHWDAGDGNLVHSQDGRTVRDVVHASDNSVFAEARSIFTISKNVSARLARYSGVSAPHLYSPPDGAADFTCESYEPFFYFPSRINAAKRQALVLQALALCTAPISVVFSGAPDDPRDLDDLKQLARRLDLEARIQWRGHIPDTEKRQLYAACLAVLYPPFDEDYGYVTLEAMLSSKPVITCDDAGGVLEFVRHGSNGLVTAPNAAALADALDTMHARPDLARLWGRASREIYEAMDITWSNVVDALMA